MGRNLTLITLGLGSMLLANLSIAEIAPINARSKFGGFHRGVSHFKMLDAPIVEKRTTATANSKVSLSGTTIAALGDVVVVVDADSGKLVLSTPSGKVLDTMAIRANAGQLAADKRKNLVYVADRDADRVWVVAVVGNKLVHKRRIATPAEPFGVALTPNGKTLLVTTVADRKLVGFATDTMLRRFTIDIPAEARGVAVRPDGREALITHLTTGTITHVDLSAKTPTTRHTALNRPGSKSNNVNRFSNRRQRRFCRFRR